MKFYNPFKPHIISIDGDFYVRRLSIKSRKWVYIEQRKDNIFWRYARSLYTTFSTLEQAKICLLNYPKLIEEHKQKNKVVHYDI